MCREEALGNGAVHGGQWATGPFMADRASGAGLGAHVCATASDRRMSHCGFLWPDTVAASHLLESQRIYRHAVIHRGLCTGQSCGHGLSQCMHGHPWAPGPASTYRLEFAVEPAVTQYDVG